MKGAQIVGTNCHFDADTSLKAIKLMKEALQREGFNNTYLMTQPLAYWTKDCNKQGFIDLPEFPFGKSERVTRAKWFILDPHSHDIHHEKY